MKRFKTFIFFGASLLGVLILIDLPVLAQGMNEAAIRGKQIYTTTCMACHQANGKGIPGAFPALNDKDFLAKTSDDVMKDTIKEGRPGTTMVSFASLGDEKIDDVVAFIRHWESAVEEDVATQKDSVSVGPVSFTGDSTTGKALFDTHCIACHRNISTFVHSTEDAVIFPTIDIVHTDSSTRDFSGAHTWAFLQVQEIRDVVVYLKNLYGAKGQGSRAALPHTQTEDPSAEKVNAKVSSHEDSPSSKEIPSDAIKKGQDLFQGKIRFMNQGPSCIACHHVKNDAVIGGGILAKELTNVFSRMGDAGVAAVLGRPPFPVMQQAYKDKALTEDEIKALVAFLEYADREGYHQQPRDYGIRLFLSGIVGVVILFGVYGIIWARRKKKSVNQDIYDRQMKSE